MKAKNNLSKLVSVLAVAAGICWMSACSDDLSVQSNLTPEQEALVGTGVHFEPYIYGFQTRAYNHDGFNRDDIFYICRQALKNESTGEWEPEEPWKSYYFKAYVDPAGNVTHYEWTIINTNDKGFQNQSQGNSDSIRWENGKQVRFRAYSKSSLSDDYLYADYAYVSGPMKSVPLEFKHLGCRIGFAPYPGNSIVKVEYCTDPKDYMRDDNADSKENADATDKFDETKAKEIADSVKAVFEQICMPGGLALYSDAGNNWWERDETGAEQVNSPFSSEEGAHPTPQFGQLTAKGTITKDGNGKATFSEVLSGKATTANTERPNWDTNIDGIRYCVMVPYGMGSENQGKPITIPADTRFRIRLKDVNTNDQEEATDADNGYHIFSLRDVKVLADDGKTAATDANGKEIEMYPDGITLRAGYSYTFYVGYKYNQLVVRVNEEGINWNTATENTELEASAEPTEPTKTKFEWWVKEMNRAAEYAMADKNGTYTPNFIIENMDQWIEFTKIVNGDFFMPSDDQVTQDETTGNESCNVEGCIMYEMFYPNNGSISKKIQKEILRKPFPFAKATVTLQCDLDFKGQVITTIGGKNNAPFQGYFQGTGHTLSNFTGTVFGRVVSSVKDGVFPKVWDLYLKSSQNISLINYAMGTYVFGISVEGPSTHAITSESCYCEFLACCHLGIGNNNGSMFGKATYNKITSSFIAAAGEGTLIDGKETEGKANTFSGCYFDRSLSPVADTRGTEYPSDVFKYEARAVLSQTLKAVSDKVPSKYEEKPNLDLFYGIAPYKVMNTSKNVVSHGKSLEYKMLDENGSNFYDRYPTLFIERVENVTNPSPENAPKATE